MPQANPQRRVDKALRRVRRGSKMSTVNVESRVKEYRLEIRAPEGVVFAYPLAGPTSRMLAWMVDIACVSVIVAAVIAPLQKLAVLSLDITAALVILVATAVLIGYTITLEWYWRGQTVGKKLLGLRVIDVQGLRLQPQQIVLRNLLRAIDQFPLFYLVGGLTVLLNRRFQRVGDWAANTVVTRVAKASEPDLDVLPPIKYNSFLAYPHIVARLVQRVSPVEARIAWESLRRREQIEPAARLELFSELAGHFRDAAPFPPEVWEGMSDEQYVRNVLECIFRKTRR